jgi:TRAP-type C4-dicarboxylate transport system permease small subunit
VRSGLSTLFSRLDRLGQLLENIALVAMLGGMIVLGFGQIVLREVFETGFVWADELIKLMVLWLAMIGAVAASRDDRHIRIDVLSQVLPDSVIKFSRMLVDAFAAAVSAVVAWQAWRYLQLEIEFQDQVLIDTPAWIAHLIVPLAFALISYRFACLALGRLSADKDPA